MVSKLPKTDNDSDASTDGVVPASRPNVFKSQFERYRHQRVPRELVARRPGSRRSEFDSSRRFEQLYREIKVSMYICYA